MHDESASQLARLETAVAADPGAAGFSALAELHRRAGRLSQAEAVARAGLAAKSDAWEGRVALVLVLLDRGLEAEARAELDRLAGDSLTLHGVGGSGYAVSEAELEQAFERAETSSGERIDPDRVAQEATLQAAPAPERGRGLLSDDVGTGGSFATETMAGLLERQGDARSAERIRAALDGAPTGSGPEAVIGELERWLRNAQRARGDRL